MKTLYRLLLLCCLASMTVADTRIATIELHHADPAQIVEVIRPLLGPDSSINHYNNQLIVNATEAEQATVREVLKQLDAAGRQLVISVRNDSSGQSGYNNVGMNDPRVVIDNNGVRTQTRTTVTVTQRSATQGGQSTQGVRATEGYPAYISTGNTIALRSSNYYGSSQQLHEVESGFYATARVDGDSVNIAIDQQDNQLKQGQITNQQLQSRVSGRLGEWIPVGVIDSGSHSDSQRILGQTNQRDSNDKTLYLKVDLAP